MIHMQEYVAPHAEAKSARKELKFQPSVLEKIKRAARSVGMDPTTFITTAALERANEIELAQYTTALSHKQFEDFAAAVDQEGKQNDALASSIAKSRALFADD